MNDQTKKPSMKLLPKITIDKVAGKTVGNKERMLKIMQDKPEHIMDVWGTAKRAVPDESALGHFIRFIGSFWAKNIQTGEVSYSGELILPKTAQNLIDGALTEDSPGIDFGFSISVRYDGTSAVQYVYDIVPMMEPEEVDPMKFLEQMKARKTQALEHKPAPQQPAATAPQQTTKDISDKAKRVA